MVQAIRSSSVHLSYFGRVIEECKALVLELQNRQVTLIFVKRSANKVANLLARHNSYRVWIRESSYPELYHVLNKDLAC